MREIFKKTEKEKREVKEKIASFLKKQKEISFAFIFGSFLEKEPIGFRDIDIAIFLNPSKISEKESFDYETELACQIGKLISFPADKIDIKILNFAPTSFQNNVFSRGELLFARDSDFLTSLIEEVSSKAVANYEISKQSLFELID